LGLRGYDTLYSDTCLPSFWSNLPRPSSGWHYCAEDRDMLWDMIHRLEMCLPVRWTQQVVTKHNHRTGLQGCQSLEERLYFLAAQERLRTVDSVLFLILRVFYHTGLVYCQFGVCSVCKVHFRLARAASQFDRPATSPITLRTRSLSS
jgi:hypothetical protein